MYEHSTKVPRHYKVAANILKKVSTEGGSLKSLIYDSKLRHYRLNVLYALITCAIRNAEALMRIFLDCQILEKEPRLDPWLARILAVEILMGRKTFPGHSKPEQTLLQYQDQIKSYACRQPSFFSIRGPRRPRYVRVNTIKLEINDFISSFKNEGYRLVPCSTVSYNDYLVQLQNLEEDQFLQDYHVKTIFAFHSNTKLHDHELWLDGKILLQDKATAMSVHLLAPEPSSVILDMCAAPGMKTTQIAAYIQCNGSVYAVERNKERYETLVDFVNKTNSFCVETLHLDAFEIGQHTRDKVEYILLDPSCSGSGMDCHVHSYEKNDGRLEKLTALQEKLLRYAMNSFPKAKRIVYSTCSLLPEENERVVKNVVKGTKGKWQVQDVKELLKGQWNNYGAGLPGTIASKCLYAKPDADLTTGFFLAVVDRRQKDKKHLIESETVNNVEQDDAFTKIDTKSSNANETTLANEMQIEGINNENDKNKVKRKCKKKRKTDIIYETLDIVSETEKIQTDFEPEISVKEKRSKNNMMEASEFYNQENKNVERKKKKHKLVSDDNATIDIVCNEVKEIIEDVNFDNKNEQELSTKKKRKKKAHIEDVTEFNSQEDEQKIIKSKKKRKNEDEQALTNVTNDFNELVMAEDVLDNQPEVSKKKKRMKDVSSEVVEEIQTEPRKKKKKKSIKKDSNLTHK